MFILRLLLTQLKSYIKAIPGIIAGAVIFIAIIASVYYGAIAFLNDKDDIEKATVAVVTNNNESEYISFALAYLSSMKSTRGAFDFKEMDSEDAYNALKKGHIIAVLDLPDNEIDSILYGENTPVTITFNETNMLSNVFLTEITKSAASMLSSAQASTYTTSDVYRTLDITNFLWDAYNDVDNINYKFVLKRQSMFYSEYDDVDPISVTVGFYTASGIILVMLLLGITFIRVAFPENDTFLFFGQNRKLFNIQYFIAKYISLYLLVTVLTFGLFRLISYAFTGFEYKFHVNFAVILTFSLFISAFISVCSNIMPTLKESVTLLFVSSLVLEIIGGLIIPQAFLPESIGKIMAYLPFSDLHNMLISCFSKNQAIGRGIFIYSAIFMILSFIGLKIKAKKLVG